MTGTKPSPDDQATVADPHSEAKAQARQMMGGEAQPLMPGTRLRQYIIRELIGAGGFGITYRADHETLRQKSFAIKEYFPRRYAVRDGTSVRSTEANSDVFDLGRRRFLQEAETLTRCSHPAIVDVVDYFEENGTVYSVLAFVAGKHMGHWLAGLERTPTQGELDRIIAPLLNALELVHGQGLLHRDIALDNILIRTDGSPCLIDFGAARVDAGSQNSQTAVFVKRGYSPPEQYLGQANLQGPWTDIYAFGAMLYRAVTGSMPAEAIERASYSLEIPAAKDNARGHFRPGFLAAIDRALLIRPEDRPQSIKAWRAMLLEPAAIPSGDVATEVQTRFDRPGERAAAARRGGLAVPVLIAGSLAAATGVALVVLRPEVVFGPPAAKPPVVASVPQASVTPPAPEARPPIAPVPVPTPAVVPPMEPKPAAPEAARPAPSVPPLLPVPAATPPPSATVVPPKSEPPKPSPAAAPPTAAPPVVAPPTAPAPTVPPKQASNAPTPAPLPAPATPAPSVAAVPPAPPPELPMPGARPPPVVDKSQLWRDCLAKAPDGKVKACRALIQSGAAATESELAQAHLNLGMGLREQGDSNAALAAFEQALRLAPALAPAYNHRGIARLDLGDRRGAIADFGEAIRADAGYGEAYNNRAWTYYRDNRAAEGLADADRAVALLPRESYVWDTRGHIHEALGKRQEAIRDYREAVKLDQRSTSSIEGLKRVGGAR
jgi:predicted negative regulator of RcsB-dependent stress response